MGQNAVHNIVDSDKEKSNEEVNRMNGLSHHTPKKSLPVRAYEMNAAIIPHMAS